jgi:hypothetical protein
MSEKTRIKQVTGGPTLVARTAETAEPEVCSAPTSSHVDGAEVCAAGHVHYTGRHHGPHRAASEERVTIVAGHLDRLIAVAERCEDLGINERNAVRAARRAVGLPATPPRRTFDVYVRVPESGTWRHDSGHPTAQAATKRFAELTGALDPDADLTVDLEAGTVFEYPSYGSAILVCASDSPHRPRFDQEA